MGTPGGYEDEDKQKSPMDDWSKLPRPDDMPVFGQQPRKTPLPPLPDPVHPTHRPEHGGWESTSKQPDEEPLDWRTYVVPTDPGDKLDTLRRLKPGQKPQAPNTHQDRIDPGLRDMYWMAFGEAADHVDGMRQAIAPDYAAFLDGTHNADLQALGFTLPRNGAGGDASAFTDQQHLAGGMSMASLFNKDGSLNLTKKDQAGMQTAQNAFDKHSAAKPEHDLTVSADHELKAALHDFESAKDAVKRTQKDVEVATLGVQEVQLSQAVDNDKENLEKAKGHAESVQKSLEFIFGGALKYMVAGPEEAVDALEGVGAMASFAVSKVSGHSIDAAEAVLAKDTEKLHDVQAERARLKLESAKISVLEKLGKLKSKRETLMAALGKRKEAYVVAGTASAHASGGDAGTQHKIASFMTAIPEAEALVGILRNLSLKCSDPGPAYSSAAGSGFAMAVYDGSPEATNMVSTLGNIAYLRSKFGTLLHQWETRLSSLQKARTQIGGQRAEIVDDELKASVENDKALKPGAE